MTTNHTNTRADTGQDPLGRAEKLLRYSDEEAHFTPLDDLSRRRMVEEIVGAMEQDEIVAGRAGGTRHRVWIAAAGIAVVLAGAAAAAYHLGSSERAVDVKEERPESIPLKDGILVLAQGDVTLDGAPASGIDAEIGDQRVVATGEGRFLMELPTGVKILAERETTIKMERFDDSMIAVRVDRGRILASVSPRRDGPTLEVRTRAGKAIVTGTIFSVEAGEKTMLEVFRGSVRVEDDGLPPRAVGSSHFTTLGAPDIGMVGADREAEVLALQRSLDLLGEAGGVEVSISSVPSGATVRLGDVIMGNTPIDLRVRPGHRNLDITLEGHSPVRERMELVPGVPLERLFELRPNPTSESSTTNREADHPGENRSSGARGMTETLPSAAVLLREAQDLRAARAWRGAANSCRRLLEHHPDSSEARTATISLASIELNQLGNPSRALELFDLYLFQGGPLSPEASWGRIRALEALGRKMEEKASLEDFIKRYPSSLRIGAARERLAILIEAGSK